jgi:low density lipoprotein-related protein 2
MGGGEKTLFFTEADTGIVGNPYCIAFDWVGRNLYIGNIDASEISLVRVEGKLKYRMLVIDSRSGNETGVAQPIALALLPKAGKLFWLDRGGNGVPTKIGKANMDGTYPEVIVRGLEGPEFLTIDIQKEILFFSTSRQAKIESCNLDGTNRRTILSSEQNHPVAKPTGIAVLVPVL